MHIPRTGLRRLAVTIFSTLVLSSQAQAQQAPAWPNKPLTVVVPYSAGGPTDFIARILAGSLAKELGQTVLVSNRPGASGTIGVQSVKEAPADGYTLLHTTVAAQALNPTLYPEWKVNPATDFIVIGTTATLPNVLVVSPELGVSSLNELISLGKSKPDGMTFATFGIGTSPHILGMLFQKSANLKAIPVAYKGSAPAMIDVISGQVDFSFDNITTSGPQVKAGKVKALAIASPNRSHVLPDVPTLAELGYSGFDLSFGFSLSIPAGAPKEVVLALQNAFEEVTHSSDYAGRLKERGAEPLLVKKEEVAGYIDAANLQWGKVARELNLKGDQR